jgi:hypothetical protein
MSLEDDLQEMRGALLSNRRSIQNLTELVEDQMKLIDMLIARAQVSEIVNLSTVTALRNNELFVGALKLSATHFDASFNGSTRTDGQIDAFKTNLRNLLPAELKQLAD